MLFSGCKVTINNSFLQVLRVKSCKKMHISGDFVHKSVPLNKNNTLFAFTFEELCVSL